MFGIMEFHGFFIPRLWCEKVCAILRLSIVNPLIATLKRGCNPAWRKQWVGSIITQTKCQHRDWPRLAYPNITFPKFNIDPENWCLKSYFPFKKLNFQGQAVKLQLVTQKSSPLYLFWDVGTCFCSRSSSTNGAFWISHWNLSQERNSA